MVSTVEFEHLIDAKLKGENLTYIYSIRGDDYLEEENLKPSSVVEVYNFETNSFYKLEAYSKFDSIITLATIAESEYMDKLYMIKQTNQNDSLTYKILETDYTFSYTTEYNIDIPNIRMGSFPNIVINQESIIISGHESFQNPWDRVHNWYFSFPDMELQEYNVENGLNHYFAYSFFDDTTILKVGFSYIWYYDSLGQITDTVTYADRINFVGHVNTFVDNELFFAGDYSYSNSNFESIEVFGVYKHTVNTNEVESIYRDTIGIENGTRALFNIQSIDTSSIYTGYNLQSCFALNTTVDCSFRLYSLRSDGTLNWTHDIGGNAAHSLEYVIATPDTGVLALYYYYDENFPDNKSDIYWMKFNKDGSQDLDYLTGFNEVLAGIEPSIIETSNVNVFPNPSSGQVVFNFPNQTSEGEIQLYNTIGQLMQTVKVRPNQMKQQLDLKRFPKGLYYWYFGDESGRLVLE